MPAALLRQASYAALSKAGEFMSSASPVLFLTNNDNTRELQKLLKSRDEDLVVYDDRISAEWLREIDPSFLISFNYQYIIKPDVIEVMGGRAVNVHCSLLPFNKGSNPNVFSFYTDTPKGVTIHELSAELDGGRILLQSELPLTDEETFKSSYDKLLDEAIRLVSDNWEDLKHLRIRPIEQIGAGSYHTYAEFKEIRQKHPFEWDDRVCDWKKRSGLL